MNNQYQVKKFAKIDQIPKEEFENIKINSKYLLINEIGRGTFGLVYKAKDLSNSPASKEKFLAIKMMLMPEVKTESDKIREEETKDEIKKYAKQIFNPRVVKIQDYLQWNEYLLIVMEYVDGKSFQEFIKEKDYVLSLQELTYYFSEIALALQGIHDMKMVHRDVKPANILLTSDHQIKITDFGISHVKGFMYGDGGNMQKSRRPSSPGTPKFISPEQYVESENSNEDLISYQSDIYSLGVMLYEVATGSDVIKINDPKLFAPSEDKLRKERNTYILSQALSREIIPPSSLNPTINPDLEQVIMKCLEKNVADRYRTAAEVASDLNKISMGIAIDKVKIKNEIYKYGKKIESENEKFTLFDKKFTKYYLVPLIVSILIILFALFFILVR